MALIGTIETEFGPASYHIITARHSYKFFGVRLIISSYYDEARRGNKAFPPTSKPIKEQEIVFSEFPDAVVPDYPEAYTFINALPAFSSLVSDEEE